MYDPLNPLGLHSENRYRSPVYSMGAETEVFEGIGSKLVGGGIKATGKGIGKVGKISWKGIKGTGRFAKKGYTNIKNVRTANLAKKAAMEGGDKAVLSTFNKITVKGVGKAVVIVGGVAFSVMAFFGANEMLDNFVDNFTGANCGKKVADRGLTEGTPEYEEAVKECQQNAFNKLAGLSLGIVGVGALVGFLVIKKYLPKGSKEESKEE
tara:strand:+ start:128 stop:754 length:627 start_codon:yes stop_codon:yes gene_type:complete